MISIPMSPNQLMAAIEKLKAREGTILTPHFEGATYGHVHIPEMDADYMYNVQTASLELDQIKKHGMAKFVSDDTIKQKLLEELGDLNCPTSTTQAPDQS